MRQFAGGEKRDKAWAVLERGVWPGHEPVRSVLRCFGGCVEDGTGTGDIVFPVTSCPGPLQPALQAAGVWVGASGALLPELGGEFEAGGQGKFVDGIRCESQSFPSLVPSEIPL